MRKRFVFVLKIAIATAGFTYLLLTGRLSMGPLSAAFADPFTISGMIALQVILLMLGVYRWWLLLRTVDSRPHSYRSLLAFNWIGQFFGCFAPSAITTDATRMAYVRSSGEATTSAVVTSLVIDRLCGIIGALLLTLVLARDLLIRVEWISRDRRCDRCRCDSRRVAKLERSDHPRASANGERLHRHQCCRTRAKGRVSMAGRS
jgi:hypothetical protein